MPDDQAVPDIAVGNHENGDVAKAAQAMEQKDIEAAVKKARAKHFGEPTVFNAEHPDLLPCWGRLFSKLRK